MVASYGGNHSTPGGKLGSSSSMRVLDLLRHPERIRARRQQHGEAGDGLVVEPQSNQ